MKALIVEDSDNLARSIAMTLEEVSFNIPVASDLACINWATSPCYTNYVISSKRMVSAHKTLVVAHFMQTACTWHDDTDTVNQTIVN
ncbi:hypothetical protein [Vreelandella alkaliphila]|uniref:hypothetical protein n=1 Tax=Vreelandella alkaliphila TaxID=272774 RepID=UPI003FD7C221